MTDTAHMPAEISSLVKHLKKAAEQQRLELKEKTDAEIQAIQADVETRKKELWDTGVGSLEEIEQRIIESTLKRARIDSELRVKRTIGKAIDDLLADTKARLNEFVSGDAFPAVLDQLIVEAVTAAQTFRKDQDGQLGKLMVNPAHEQVAKASVDTHGFKVTVTSDETLTDGVVLAVDGTNYSVTNTLTSRFQKRENAIQMAIAEILNKNVSGTD